MRLPLFITICFALTSCISIKKEKLPSIKVSLNEVLEENFIGIGVQMSAYPWYDLSDGDWEKIVSRIDFMKMPFTRIMVDMTDFFCGLDDSGNPAYNFESKKMKKLFKLLDYCQENNIEVLFGQWGAANTAKYANNENWDIPLDSPLHAKVSVDLIDYIINTKNYTCIKWYNLINEPDGSWSSIDGNLELWKIMVQNLYIALKEVGLQDKIQIAGPDNTFSNWHYTALEDDEFNNTLGIYEKHIYAKNEEDILSGKMEIETKDFVDQIKVKDRGKKYFLGELGILDGKNEFDQQVNVNEFWYGVSMTDAAIQQIRGGSAGVIAWYLDDAMHYNGDSDGPQNIAKDAYEKRKIWGMWNIVGAEHYEPEDENLRPWYYPWSVLSRNFKKGSNTLQVEHSGIRNLRCAAVKFNENDKLQLSVAIVNNSDYTRKIKLVIPELENRIDFAVYQYFDTDGDNIVDAWPATVDKLGKDDFPKPTEVWTDIDLKKGVAIEMKSRGVIILSSQDAQIMNP